MSAGSEQEPTTEPDEVVEQMRTATERLRDQAWMVAPMIAAQPMTDDAEDGESAEH